LHFRNEIYDRTDSGLDTLLDVGVIGAFPAEDITPDGHPPIAMGGDHRSSIHVLSYGVGWKDAIASFTQESQVRYLGRHDGSNRPITLAIRSVARSAVVRVEVSTGELLSGIDGATDERNR